MVATLMMDQSTQMQGVKMIRLSCQDLRVNPFRLRHAAGLMVRKSLGKQ